MIRLAITIQHAAWQPARVHALEQLIGQLITEMRDLPIDLAVASPATVVDRGDQPATAEGVWPVNRRAWLEALRIGQNTWPGQGATHVLVLQDDMRLCQGFFTGLGLALRSIPGHYPVCLLCGRKSVLAAMEKGHRWLGLRDGTWGGSTVLPAFAVGPWIEWVDTNVMPECPSADARLDLWLRSQQALALATIPSMIEHRDLPSLIGHSRGRGAAIFADDWDQGAVHFDGWKEAPVDPPRLHKSMFQYLRPDERFLVKA